jgi:uncharacterized SAM-binding protein YcdF (DUF218 family)
LYIGKDNSLKGAFMKRWLLFALLTMAVIGGAAAQSLRGKTMYVQVKSVAVKASTGFFAGTRGTLQLGDTVTVLQENGKWVEVRSTARSSLSGWMASSSLTTKRIVASSGTSASAGEIALAGKGFNQEVENAYKQNGALDYKDIDAMEAQTVPDNVLLNFITEGHLAGGE